jgi:hypothetical protein
VTSSAAPQRLFVAFPPPGVHEAFGFAAAPELSLLRVYAEQGWRIETYELSRPAHAIVGDRVSISFPGHEGRQGIVTGYEPGTWPEVPYTVRLDGETGPGRCYSAAHVHRLPDPQPLLEVD